MTQPKKQSQSEDQSLPVLDEASLKRGDEILRRMLEAPPKSHDAMTAKKAPKKRAKKPRK